MGSSEAKRIIRNAIASVFGIAVANWVVNYILAFFISEELLLNGGIPGCLSI